MKLDTRAIVITITVIILGVATWLLIQPALDEDTSAATTSRGLGGTTTTTRPPEPTTTTVAPTSAATTSATTRPPEPTTTSAAPTTTAASTTTTDPLSTTPATEPLKEPDLSLCHDNDLPETQCRWVGVEHPRVTADPRQEPIEYLRQYGALIDWSTANLDRGRDRIDLVADGENYEELMDEAFQRGEAGVTHLTRVSVDDPVEVLSSSDDRVELTATIVVGRIDVLTRNGDLQETYEAQPPATWAFTIEFTEKFREERWRVTEMGEIEG